MDYLSNILFLMIYYVILIQLKMQFLKLSAEYYPILSSKDWMVALKVIIFIVSLLLYRIITPSNESLKISIGTALK